MDYDNHTLQILIGAMAGKRYWRAPEALDSCKPLFKEFKILTVYSLYILESAKFVKKYPEKFTKNVDHPETCIHVTRNTIRIRASSASC
jgi:hypothetical protein